jgi:hypothetical protein
MMPGVSVAALRTRLTPAATVRDTDARDAASPAPRPWKLLVFACLALAALSLLLPSNPTYDPWAWIIWGREIAHLDLVTTSGPSWKPLPVFFTTAFSLAGDDAAPDLWLVIARAGAFLSIAMAYRLGARLGGWPAGLIAAAALLFADGYVRTFWRGNSEGILLALCLLAIERHLDGRRADAFVLGFGAALLRPEVWPFFGLYGLWLAWVEPRRRWLVLGCFAANGILWFAPEYWGSGDWLRAANRAHQPNPDSPAFADRPFLEVFRLSSGILAPPVLLGAALSLIKPIRARRWDVRCSLFAAAAFLMIVVGLMTEAGFAGNLRYVALPAALVCVLAGVGWVDVVGWAGARFGRAGTVVAAGAIVALAAVFLIANLGVLKDSWDRTRTEADFYDTLPAAIAKAGGREALTRCHVFTGPYQVPSVAWHLKLHTGQVGLEPTRPGILIAPHDSRLADDESYPLVTTTRRWVVRSDCAA